MYRLSRPLVVTIVALLNMPFYQTAAAADYGSIHPLQTGPFLHVPHAKLGPPVRFINEIDETTCHELSINNKKISWIHAAYKTKSTLVLFLCEKYEQDAFTPPGAITGGAVDAMYELSRKKNQWTMTKLLIPGYDGFSRPAICGELIAYWASEGNGYSAAVYDLAKRQQLKKQRVGEFTIGTDDSSYLPLPVWQESCNEVRFPEHDDLKEPIIIKMR